MNCPCCDGTGQAIHNVINPACECITRLLDPRNEAQRRRLAFLQRIALKWLEDSQPEAE